MATRDDIPTLAAMRWSFRAEEREAPVEDEAAFAARYSNFVLAGMASNTWTYWVAEDDSELVGQMAVCVVCSIPRPTRLADQWGYLTDVYVRPTHRNAGVGSALLTRVRAWAVERDLELLLVWPSDASLSFYRRAGFAPGGDNLQFVLRTHDAQT